MNGDQAALLRSFALTRAQRREVWAHWQDCPEGVERVALDAREIATRNGNSGAGLFLHMLRKGEQFEAVLADRRRITGWRWTRGTHGETWIRDPKGRDIPPRGYAAGG